jgi:hypothetical protein
MREAFVLLLGPECDPATGQFVGWIEEVDTGRELRFKSTDQLLQFFSQCLIEWRRKDQETGRDERLSKDD